MNVLSLLGSFCALLLTSCNVYDSGMYLRNYQQDKLTKVVADERKQEQLLKLETPNDQMFDASEFSLAVPPPTPDNVLAY
jgi:hypothetical protein